MFYEGRKHMKVDAENYRLFWWYISERSRIWHKRVELRQPAPWTDDLILQRYKFTNVFRELDRLTLYYIENVMSHIKDSGDKETIEKEVLLNTLIYRLYVKIPTWEMIGYLKLETFDTQWEKAKKTIKSADAKGYKVFTNAFFVNPMRYINPTVTDESIGEIVTSKVDNSFYAVEYWKEHLDEIYNNVKNSRNMQECLEYLFEIPAIGRFFAYEIACDLTYAKTFYKVDMVSFDINSYTNVGPGAKVGLDRIFPDRERTPYIDLIFWLYNNYEREMKKFGFKVYYPKKFKKLNLRSIEHSLCEFGKYCKALYDGKHLRAKFDYDSFSPADELIL